MTGLVAGVLVLLLTILLVLMLVQRVALRQAYAAASDATRRTRGIFDSTIDALVFLDPAGAVERVNATAIALLGYAEAELAGRDVSTFLDIAPGGGGFAQRIGLVEGRLRQSFRADCKARRRDGHAIALDAALRTVPLAGGTYVVVSLREVSERERADRMRDDLLLQVSHALQTPLANVAVSLELLQAMGPERLPAGAGELVETADRTCRQLVRLVDDLLDQDRVEGGAGQRIPFDLRQAMAAVTSRRPDRPVASGVGRRTKAARYS